MAYSQSLYLSNIYFIMTIYKLPIIITALMILSSCRDRRTAPVANGNIMDDTTAVVSAPAKETVSCRIVEAMPGNFARVVFDDTVDRKTIAHDAAILTRTYERVDVCHPGATERGDQYLCFFENRVIDYETGEILLSENWVGL